MQARTLLILFFLLAISPSGYTHSKITTGAEHIAQYLSLIQGKRVGMVVNHTSIVGIEQTHLLDTLLKLDIKIVKVFAPEHGFRGNTERIYAPVSLLFHFMAIIRSLPLVN